MFGRATITLGIGPHSSLTLVHMSLFFYVTSLAFVLQAHLQKTSNPLRSIVVVKEGQESKDFKMALAA